MSTETKEPKVNFDSMEKIVESLGDQLIPIKYGTTVKGNVVANSRSRIIVDIKGIALGLIPAREYSSVAPNLVAGDEISAYVMVQENDDGYVILSLRRADKEKHLESLASHYESKENLAVRVRDVNRGGLVVQHGNIEGFLPISQLASQHYPKRGRERIQDSLKGLLNKELQVKVITFDPKANKIIFSEKAAGDSLAEEKAGQLSLGQELEGVVSGIVDFGIFVNLGELEGLVHISEVSWDRVYNLDRMFAVGDKVKVQVISVEGGRVSLSIKRLIPDPWQTAIKEFKVGSEVEGNIVRLSPFGAFIEIAKDVVGLMHISEFEANSQEELEDKIKVGDKDQFQILAIEQQGRKVGLAYPEGKRPESARKAAEDRLKEKSKKAKAKKEEQAKEVAAA